MDSDKAKDSAEDKQQVPATTDQIDPEAIQLLNEKETAYALLRQNGMNNADASQALEIKPASGYSLSHRINKKVGKPVRSLGLADSKYVKVAHRAVHKLARGKIVGDMETVTGAVVMSAANAILDRAEPVIKKQINLNVRADVSPVDLSKYLMDGQELEGPGPQDVVIECPHNELNELSD